MLSTKGGKSVSIRSVAFASYDDAVLYNTIAKVASSPNIANTLLRQFREQDSISAIDFAAGLMEGMAREGKSLFLLGAKPGVAEMAARNLAGKYPGLVIAGTHDGYFKEDAPVVEEIRLSGADVVFVCLGAPKQELWMKKHGPETGAHLLCGLGGSLDVFAGVVERAPKFWSDHGLEWFYRLCKEPRRIGRMMKLPLFLVHVKQEKRKK